MAIRGEDFKRMEEIQKKFEVDYHGNILRRKEIMANGVDYSISHGHKCLGDGVDIMEFLTSREVSEDIQTFDKLIMECDDMLDIETEVQNMFTNWMGNKSNTEKERRTVHEEVEQIGEWTFIIFGFIIVAAPKIVKLIGGPYNLYAHILVAFFGIASFAHGMFLWHQKKFGKVKHDKTEHAKIEKCDESLKFQFLKESYVGTIQKLNGKLDTIKNKIQDQISAHTLDKEKITEYGDMFAGTDDILKKIDSAIKNLNASYNKVSDKKADINKALNEYIGENGYIAQKEKEINRLKIAQELSDRMEKNFHTTLEITKSVDVLTDTIIPGIKQLMSLKIPELINNVEFECDKNRVLLEVKQ